MMLLRVVKTFKKSIPNTVGYGLIGMSSLEIETSLSKSVFYMIYDLFLNGLFISA